MFRGTAMTSPPTRSVRPAVLRAAAIVAVLAAALVVPCVFARHGDVPFLSRIGRAEWITYPIAPFSGSRRAVELETRFEREFPLATVPSDARLRLRAFRTVEVRLNDQAVAPAATAGWRQPVEVDVGPLLREGANRLVVVVHNDRGPPALWLELEGAGWSLRSDGDWVASVLGATPAPARLAEVPMAEWSRSPDGVAASGPQLPPVLG